MKIFELYAEQACTSAYELLVLRHGRDRLEIIVRVLALAVLLARVLPRGDARARAGGGADAGRGAEPARGGGTEGPRGLGTERRRAKR